MGLIRHFERKLSLWLGNEIDALGQSQCDFDRLSAEIRPADVLLAEGRTRVSKVIKSITQSAWTHSALYIGRLHDITDPALKKLVREHYQGDEYDQLLIEALIGQGTLITPLSVYRGENLRLCRPRGLSEQDAQTVIEYAACHLGHEYDMKQILDLARFLFPYGILPRRWRSSLFEHHAGIPTRTVCSSMIAEAFARVHFPILPVMRAAEDGTVRLYKRNPRLYTPRDFDYSPYFDILKFPPLTGEDTLVYRNLPWDKQGMICNDANECYLPAAAATMLEEMETLPQKTGTYGSG